jgi:hypothetical protein
MEKGILQKTIPTILGIIILIVGVGVGIYLVGRQQLFGLKAGPEITPQNVTISNVGETGFTVSWVTQTATTGFVRLGETEKLDKTVNDYRDQLTGENKTYTTHYINIENLKASTKYFFKVGSGSSNNLYDNVGRPFEITTGPALGTQPTTDIIYGRVLDATKQPAEGAIVYLSLANAAPISALVGKDGMWAKPLHTARTTDLNSYITYDVATSVLTIKATLGLGQSDNAQVLVTTKNDTPVPNVILGQDQDYRAEEEAPTASPGLPTTPQSSPASQFPIQPTPASESAQPPQENFSSLADLEATPSATNSALLITAPSQGEEVNTLKPQVIGKGPKGKVLTIRIESPQAYTGTTTIDQTGNWTFTAPNDLSAGTHTVTASYVDENGTTQSVSQQFVVLAEGASQLPAFEASPSGSTSPSGIPRVSMPSTEGGVPRSGVVGPTFIVFLSGLGFLILGFWLQFFSKRDL